MNKDVSNRTVFILVMLTLIISTIGTLTVLTQTETPSPTPLPIGESQSTTGSVHIELLPKQQVTSVTIENT